MNAEDIRLLNASLSVLIVMTLIVRVVTSWSSWPDRPWENRFRGTAQSLVFVASAYASIIAFHSPRVPLMGYVYVVTAGLLAYLVTLWTPWRWRRN